MQYLYFYLGHFIKLFCDGFLRSKRKSVSINIVTEKKKKER